MKYKSILLDSSFSILRELLIDYLPINIFILDKEGYLVWGNSRMIKTLNETEASFIGKHISYWGEDKWKACKKVLRDGNEQIVEEIGIDQKIYLTNRIPVKEKFDNNLIQGVIGISLDISEQKQAQIAKQEFLMNMAHDLRTPLTGIIALSNIQSKEGTSTEDRLYSQWIENAGYQLLELLNSVLEVTAAEHHIESLEQNTIDLQQLAEELHILMKPIVVAKGLEFELKLSSHLPKIIVDRIKLKRILLNLLSNAIKFTKQGKISLQLNTLTVKKDEAKIEILIADTGIGIAADKLDKIFDRFYRVYPSYHAEYKGYGIGLFLVKKSVELLNGKIKVSSQEGKGSCFTVMFNFPLSKEKLEKVRPPISQPSPSKPADKQTQSVLIAEDNTLVLHVAKKLLLDLGYEATTVMHGKAAFKALQTQCFDWALLDIGLPDLDGIEIVRRFRQWEQKNKKSHLPIFALTAHLEKNIVDKCKSVGFDYVLNKPFTEKDIQIIQKIID